ncbi:hypothetical protein [Caulobacter sp. S45]|uniref:VgrG-related protein n=1 Tax=Caulobacter sp. S45 TaxID=1641861 RepID=UPI00131B7E5F|nr:hypothetical protein [Caulobacter sp. S45]
MGGGWGRADALEQAASSLEGRGSPPEPEGHVPKTSPANGTPPAPQKTPSATAPQQKAGFRPGALSARYESNGDPGAISTGKGDPGSVSYEAYQIKKANVAAFVAHEGAKWPELQGKTPGSAGFGTAWKAVAAKDPKGFEAAQYAYIARTHYQPQLDLVRQATGVDVPDRSHALQDVVWSSAVQHGPASHIVSGAIHTAEAHGSQPTDSGFDAAVINAVYDERGRARPDGVLVHFHRSSSGEQRGIAARFRSERRRALAGLTSEGQ